MRDNVNLLTTKIALDAGDSDHTIELLAIIHDLEGCIRLKSTKQNNESDFNYTANEFSTEFHSFEQDSNISGENRFNIGSSLPSSFEIDLEHAMIYPQDISQFMCEHPLHMENNQDTIHDNTIPHPNTISVIGTSSIIFDEEMIINQSITHDSFTFDDKVYNTDTITNEIHQMQILSLDTNIRKDHEQGMKLINKQEKKSCFKKSHLQYSSPLPFAIRNTHRYSPSPSKNNKFTTKNQQPNLSIFKSPSTRRNRLNVNEFDEDSYGWRPTYLTGKYNERFQYSSDIVRWNKLNAMLSPTN